MPGRLTSRLIRDWIRPQITTGARVVAGRIPDMPNRVISIVLGTGPGLEMEGLFDVHTLAITCRGAENNLDDAENIAFEVDDILTGRALGSQTENFLIEESDGPGVFVNGIGRSGSGPSQLPIPDPQSRFSYTCNYYAQVATNIGSVFNG